jgi:hypothetical protein
MDLADLVRLTNRGMIGAFNPGLAGDCAALALRRR